MQLLYLDGVVVFIEQIISLSLLCSLPSYKGNLVAISQNRANANLVKSPLYRWLKSRLDYGCPHHHP